MLNCWEVKPELHNCPLSNPSKVAVSPAVQRKVRRLNERFPHLEWMAYLFVDDSDDTKYVADLVIPKQIISKYAVEPLDFPMVDGIRGSAHSHHHLSLGASFSPQDDRYLRGNHDVSIVVSGEQWKVSTRETAPCGNYNYVDAEVVFMDKVPGKVSVLSRSRVPLVSWLSRIGGVKQPVVPVLGDAFDQEIEDNITVEGQRPQAVTKVSASSGTRRGFWKRLGKWLSGLNYTGRIGR